MPNAPSMDGIPEEYHPLLIQLRKAEVDFYPNDRIHAAMVMLLAFDDQSHRMHQTMQQNLKAML